MAKGRTITASEAVFGFMAWLTCRKETVKFGARDDAGKAVKLIGEWLDANKLPGPRPRAYPRNITQPPTGYTKKDREKFARLKAVTVPCRKTKWK